MKHKAKVILVLVAGTFCAMAQDGTISGVVQDDTSKPLAGVTVLYKILAPQGGASGKSIALPPSVNSQTVSDAGGSFRITGLPSGQYYICGLASAGGQLSSCSYGPRPLIVTVNPSADVSGVRIVMRAGSVVRVHVKDSKQQIGLARRFVIGSRANDGTYEFAHLVSQTGEEWIYELTFPSQRGSKLVIDTDLKVTDEAGVPVTSLSPAVDLAAITSGVSSLAPIDLIFLVK